MKIISLKIPESLERRLQHSAQEGGISKSEVLRRALETYLTQGDSARAASVGSLAGDLAGCFSGPADLSTNADHLSGFGR